MASNYAVRHEQCRAFYSFLVTVMYFMNDVLSESVPALSVTFGDSSPKGRAKGISVRLLLFA